MINQEPPESTKINQYKTKLPKIYQDKNKLKQDQTRLLYDIFVFFLSQTNFNLTYNRLQIHR